MKNCRSKIKAFTDLEAWKEGRVLVSEIYTVTKMFPKAEMFGLVAQMRRCAVSVTSNIAEGFSRRSYKEKKQFYSIALGSLTELQSQLLISKDVKYISEEELKKFAERTAQVHKLINGLVKSAKTLPNT